MFSISFWWVCTLCHFAEGSVVHLPFDELIEGKIPGDIVGTAKNIAKLSTGVKGKALQLDGANQWVALGNHRHRYCIISAFYESLS